MAKLKKIAPTDNSKAHLAGMMVSFFKAAGDPLRLDILRVLKKDSFGVQELAKIFGMAQPAMSHHLKLMTNAGLLESRRQGNSIFYRRALVRDDTQFSQLQISLFAEIDALDLEGDFQVEMESIYQERAQRSQSFFEKNASEFLESQGKLCELNHYLANMLELLDIMHLPKHANVLEVGPGQGFFLKELSGRFRKLTALDNSEEMLGLAQKNLEFENRDIKFVQSALEDYQLQNDQPLFDVAVLNMVLHHMPSPAAVFEKLHKIVAMHGYLLIAELGAHNQDWTRESCGDIWLGFDSDELDEWALNSGFEEKQSLFLGLKNGFQIQLKLFQRL